MKMNSMHFPTDVDIFLDDITKKPVTGRVAHKRIRDKLIQKKVPNSKLLPTWEALDFHRMRAEFTFRLWYRSLFFVQAPHPIIENQGFKTITIACY